MAFTLSQAASDAMLIGGVDSFINAGTTAAYAKIFAGNTLLVTMVFAKPATAFANHELTFAQGNAGGDQISVTGVADSFTLYNGLDQIVGAGDVSAVGGTGALKISGTSGTTMYAGARAILGELKFI